MTTVSEAVLSASSAAGRSPQASQAAGVSVLAVSGNPRAGSRTSRVARTVAEVVAAGLDGSHHVISIELADVASEVFASDAPRVAAALATVSGARVAVIATPVYKASYTGLLKAFLDRYGPGALRGVIALPVVISASPAHSFVADQLLRPLLTELGASVPVAPLALTESQLDALGAAVDAWAEAALPVLRALVATRAVSTR